jgi:hypothetical protein
LPAPGIEPLTLDHKSNTLPYTAGDSLPSHPICPLLGFACGKKFGFHANEPQCYETMNPNETYTLFFETLEKQPCKQKTVLLENCVSRGLPV